jgi:hypothetical protein
VMQLLQEATQPPADARAEGAQAPERGGFAPFVEAFL